MLYCNFISGEIVCRYDRPMENDYWKSIDTGNESWITIKCELTTYNTYSFTKLEASSLDELKLITPRLNENDIRLRTYQMNGCDHAAALNIIDKNGRISNFMAWYEFNICDNNLYVLK